MSVAIWLIPFFTSSKFFIIAPLLGQFGHAWVDALDNRNPHEQWAWRGKVFSA